jgi:hypothetical protein
MMAAGFAWADQDAKHFDGALTDQSSLKSTDIPKTLSKSATQTAKAKTQLDQVQSLNPQYGTTIPEGKGTPDNGTTKTATGSMSLGAKPAEASGSAGSLKSGGDGAATAGVMKGTTTGATGNTKFTKYAERNIGAPVGFSCGSAAQVASLPPGTPCNVITPTGQVLTGKLKSRTDGENLYNTAAYVSNNSVTAAQGVGGGAMPTSVTWEPDRVYKLSRYGVTKGEPYALGYYTSDQDGRDKIGQGGIDAGMAQMVFAISPNAKPPYDAYVYSGGGKGGGGKANTAKGE